MRAKIFAAGFLAGSLLVANASGYVTAKNLMQDGYSPNQLEAQFWREYENATRLDKTAFLTIRPGIKLAYMLGPAK